MKKLLFLLLISSTAIAQEKPYKLELTLSEIQTLVFCAGQSPQISAKQYTDLAEKIQLQLNKQADTTKTKK